MMDWLTLKYLLLVAGNPQTPVDTPTRQDLGLPNVAADQNFATDILAIVFGIAGAIAVLVIIIGAFNITKSGGDPEAIARGKRTVVYALIGLLVCVSAELIIAFVLERL